MFWGYQSDLFLTLCCTRPPPELCQGRWHVWAVCLISLGNLRTESPLHPPQTPAIINGTKIDNQQVQKGNLLILCLHHAMKYFYKIICADLSALL